MKKRVIYLDNAATTPVRAEVLLAMKPYWNESFGNPGSITKLGVAAKRAVEQARQTVADCLCGRPAEVIFTSGGTESNNLAIFGVVNYILNQPPTKLGAKRITDLHFITTQIEHSSITECFKALERRGAQVDYLAVDSNGLIDLADLRKCLKANTVLVSIGYANNEIGVIQPLKEIAKEVRHARNFRHSESSNYPYLHTDASQAGLYCNLALNELGVDLLTLDAQKINGPKGVGVLFVRAGTSLDPLIYGGGQERGLRAGTENVPLIVGLAKALELCQGSAFGMSKSLALTSLRDYFWQKIKKEIPTAVLNGDPVRRLPNNLNISLPGLDSEFTVLCLDEAGIISSTRSACSHDEDGSAVVRALGQGQSLSRSTLRFSLGEDITKKDIDFVVKKLTEIVKRQKLASL